MRNEKSSPTDPQGLESYQIKPSDSIDLWKYFHDQVFQLKHSLTTIITWLLGITLGLMAIMIERKLINFEDSMLKFCHPSITIAFSFFGLLICGYCLYLIRDYAESINRLWWSAEVFRRKINPLDKIYAPAVEAPPEFVDMSMPPLCRDLRWVVVGLIFVLVIIICMSIESIL